MSTKLKDKSTLEGSKNIIKQPGPIPKAAWFIVVMELCERFAFYGASLLFVPYTLDVLDLGPTGATAINREFAFFCYLTTILGATAADLYLGKFRTILAFSFVYLTGLIILSVSATTASLESKFALPGFCIALYLLISWGTGGIKANVSAFAAEQVAYGLTPSGEGNNIYYDYNMTVERVFRYFYFSINIGSLTGQLLTPIIVRQGNSYPLAFGLPAIVFVIGMIIFYIGSKCYFEREIKGNPLFKAIKCIRYAFINRGQNSNAEHWLDNAKINNKPDEYEVTKSAINPGLILEWDDTFVDELKKTLRASRVFFFYIFYWALYYNMSDIFIIMGTSMEHPSWLGPEQLLLIAPIMIILCIPLFDSVLFPALRRSGFHLGPITRITIGFILCTLGFVYATILQYFVYQTGPYFDFTGAPKGATNNISIWWQLPAYALVAISEIFSAATGLEFAFKYAAPELKSVVTAIYLLTTCGGALIGLVLAIWSVNPNFVIIYAIETSIMFILSCLFWYLFGNQDE